MDIFSEWPRCGVLARLRCAKPISLRLTRDELRDRTWSPPGPAEGVSTPLPVPAGTVQLGPRVALRSGVGRGHSSSPDESRADGNTGVVFTLELAVAVVVAVAFDAVAVAAADAVARLPNMLMGGSFHPAPPAPPAPCCGPRKGLFWAELVRGRGARRGGEPGAGECWPMSIMLKLRADALYTGVEYAEVEKPDVSPPPRGDDGWLCQPCVGE